MLLQVQQLTGDLQKARQAIKEAEDANVKALQDIQKSSTSLESCKCELQDAQEQIRQLQVGPLQSSCHSLQDYKTVFPNHISWKSDYSCSIDLQLRRKQGAESPITKSLQPVPDILEWRSYIVTNVIYLSQH